VIVDLLIGVELVALRSRIHHEDMLDDSPSECLRRAIGSIRSSDG
jgi:hypothetical protein